MLRSFVVLILVLITAGAALVGLVVFMMARILLMPPRMVGGKALWILKRLSPEDLDLPYEDLSFDVADEATGGREKLRLPAWWIPAREPGGDRCVVIVHGYADSKVGGIAWAPTFVEMGWNVLAVDLRAHGEAQGRYTTAGYFERHDLSQIVDQIRATRPGQTRRLVLFGVSLGAAVVGGTADLRQAEAGGACDVDAVIMECPYRDYPGAAQTHAAVMGMPGPMFQGAAIKLAERMSGADFYACSPVDVIPRLRCPVMVIHGAEDLFIDPAHMDAVEAATRGRAADLGPTVYWRAQKTHHVLALASDPALFRRMLEDFLASAEAWGAQCRRDPRPPARPDDSQLNSPAQEVSP
jgi:fermentation-respiration switch protein FrsA (DUF1100 family)